MASPETKLLIFGATWCGPCKALAPVIEKVSKRYPSIQVSKIDVEENSELATKYHVQGLPKLVVEKNGKVVNEHTGYLSEERLIEALNLDT